MDTEKHTDLRDKTIGLLNLHLGDLAQLPGGTLYSGWSALTKGDVYLMGLNPGGSNAPSVLTNTLKNPDVGSAYFDDDWGNKRHQVRVRDLVENGFGRRMEDTFSANALFVQTRTDDEIADPWSLWEKCWPIHQFFLSIVKPKLIVCLGNGDSLSSFRLIREKTTKPATPYEMLGPNFRYGKLVNATLALGDSPPLACTILGIPHPSRFNTHIESDALRRLVQAG